MCWRFIENVFLLYYGTLSDLMDFCHYLNKANVKVSLSAELSKEWIHFQDFIKEMTVNYILHYYCNPQIIICCCTIGPFIQAITKNNILYGQFQRLRKS